MELIGAKDEQTMAAFALRGHWMRATALVLVLASAVSLSATEFDAPWKDPTVALTCYRLKSVPGQPRFAPRDAAITNQFGNATVTATKARTLCVPSSIE